MPSSITRRAGASPSSSMVSWHLGIVDACASCRAVLPHISHTAGGLGQGAASSSDPHAVLGEGDERHVAHMSHWGHDCQGTWGSWAGWHRGGTPCCVQGMPCRAAKDPDTGLGSCSHVESFVPKCCKGESKGSLPAATPVLAGADPTRRVDTFAWLCRGASLPTHCLWPPACLHQLHRRANGHFTPGSCRFSPACQQKQLS